MSGHATAESLSLHLDRALPAVERRRLAAHLEDCVECRQRLAGLRRVVTGLGRLPTAVPPEDLAARVRREIVLRRRLKPWRRLIDGGLSAPAIGSPPIHILALVLALGAIVYLFAVGLERRHERPTRIVPVDAASLVFGQDDRLPEAAAQIESAESLYLLGGRFRRQAGIWVEEGLGERAPDARLQLDGAAAAVAPLTAVVRREVAELAALGAPLRLRVGDEVVEIAFEPAAPVAD